MPERSNGVALKCAAAKSSLRHRRRFPLSHTGFRRISKQASILALQAWFAYVISVLLDLHKILLLIGPTLAGKGVTRRILGAVVGEQNVAGPTLSSLNWRLRVGPAAREDCRGRLVRNIALCGKPPPSRPPGEVESA